MNLFVAIANCAIYGWGIGYQSFRLYMHRSAMELRTEGAGPTLKKIEWFVVMAFLLEFKYIVELTVGAGTFVGLVEIYLIWWLSRLKDPMSYLRDRARGDGNERPALMKFAVEMTNSNWMEGMQFSLHAILAKFATECERIQQEIDIVQ